MTNKAATCFDEILRDTLDTTNGFVMRRIEIGFHTGSLKLIVRSCLATAEFSRALDIYMLYHSLGWVVYKKNSHDHQAQRCW